MMRSKTLAAALSLWLAGPAFADFSGPSSSSGGTPGGTSGQLQTNNGAGGFGAVAAPTGAVVGNTDTQTLTNKSIAGSEINSGAVPMAQMPPVFGAPPYVTGGSIFYGDPLEFSATTTSVTGVANSYYCEPFWIYQTVTIKALGIHVITGSTGNSSGALQGAMYSDLVTTSNVHRPGTLIDYTANFATGSNAYVAAAMNNTTDSLVGPGLDWACVQKYDATATFGAAGITSLAVSVVGTASLANALSTSPIQGVVAAGTSYGGTNWPNFTSSTTWVESSDTSTPAVAIEVN